MSKVTDAFAPPERAPTEGAQAIKRAAAILRLVAARGGRGAPLKDIAAASGLHKATAHRILRALFEEGLLEHDAETRTYRLGIEIIALGASMGDRFDVRALARPSLEALAAETEDTVYIAVRSGFDGLCVDMCEGAYPEKTLKLSIHDRWPLGVGAYNLPLLAFLPDSEVAEIVAHNEAKLAGQDLYTPARILSQVAETRARGYAVNTILSYPTMCGLGVPVLDSHERPIASLCVTAIVARMTPARQAAVAERMWVEARRIASRWNDLRAFAAPDDTWRAIAPSKG